MREAGIKQELRDLILWSVSSCNIQILFNGDKTSSFSPTRGICHGDPLSPYLFVLCMERLRRCFEKVVHNGRWKPIRLNKNGPTISHLFFTDGHILFGEASMDQMEVMMDCMDTFCVASDQRVNTEKTQLLVSNNMNHN